VWYTRDAGWDGVFSTYRYDWTSGDRFGFAPVTITEGADLLGLGGGGLTASGGGGGARTTSAVGAKGLVDGGLVWGLVVGWWVVFFVFGGLVV
jgi:hypothetical protein